MFPTQTQVGGKKTTVLLPKLTPDTEYSISVVAVYAGGVSRELNGLGKTSKSAFTVSSPKGQVMTVTPMINVYSCETICISCVLMVCLSL